MITVIMPVYNAEKYLSEAINSILMQSYQDFEFLIIDDGSTDSSQTIIESFKDKRINYQKNQTNLGLIKTLNKGLKIAKGDYIARMDADDISLPNRLEVQLDYLQKNPDISICGSSFKVIGNRTCSKPSFISHEKIKIELLFHCPLAHPTIFFRKKDLAQYKLNYNLNAKHVEDYDLWVRCSHHLKLTQLHHILLHYRWHEDNISIKFKADQALTRSKIHVMQLEKLHISPSEKLLSLHENIITNKTNFSIEELKETEDYFLTIISKNEECNIYNNDILQETLGSSFFKLCFYASRYGKSTYALYQRSPLKKNCPLSVKNKIEFYLRCKLHIKK